MTPLWVIGLPSSRPRVLAVETDLPAGLFELHRRLVTRLARSPRAAAEDRYVPHVTLGRTVAVVGTGAGFGAVPVALPAFEVREVVLCRSVLKPTGAEHSAMASVSL